MRTFFVHSSVLDTEWDWWRTEDQQYGLQKSMQQFDNTEKLQLFVLAWGKQQKSREGRALNLAQIGAHWRSSPPPELFPSGRIPACCLPYSSSCLSITAIISSGLLLPPVISSGELDALSKFHVLILHKVADTQVPYVFRKQAIYITILFFFKSLIVFIFHWNRRFFSSIICLIHTAIPLFL